MQQCGLGRENNPASCRSQAQTVVDVVVFHREGVLIESTDAFEGGLRGKHARRSYGGDIPRCVSEKV